MEQLLRDLRIAFNALRRRPQYRPPRNRHAWRWVSAPPRPSSAWSTPSSCPACPTPTRSSWSCSGSTPATFRGFPAASTGELALFQDESKTLSQVSGTGFLLHRLRHHRRRGRPARDHLRLRQHVPHARCPAGAGPPVHRRRRERSLRPERHHGHQLRNVAAALRGPARRHRQEPSEERVAPITPAPEIIGVLPQGFRLELGPLSRMDGTIDSWVANRIPPQWSNRFIRVIGRLAPGVSR